MITLHGTSLRRIKAEWLGRPANELVAMVLMAVASMAGPVYSAPPGAGARNTQMPSSSVPASPQQVGKQSPAPAEARKEAEAQPVKSPVIDQHAAAPMRSGEGEVAAVVNGAPISKKEVRAACLRYFGEEVLEALLNRQLIEQQCRKLNVQITEEEVEAEVQKTAAKFKLDLKTWYELLERERGVTASEYKTEILWPMLALRKLTASELQVSSEEVQKAYESEFGEAVKVRMIAIQDANAAKKVQAEAAAQPEQFERLAKQHSQDINSAATGGLIQPVRKYRGEVEIENVAFQLQPGQVSEIVKIGEMHYILKSEGKIPPREVKIAEVKALLEERVRTEKLPSAAQSLFVKLQKEAKVENILNDPVKSKQLPGIAARVNGQPISMNELADKCFQKHGKNVTESMINRRLLEEQTKKRGVNIAKTDMDAEVARAAYLNGVNRPDGKPDVAAWIKDVEAQTGASREMYFQEAVWPSVALRKLVENSVQVSEEDIKKGYEANYGPRVRVRAIMLANQRQAQNVWAMAREKPTVENFAELASQYSIEPGGRAQGGIVPPIQKHGGQPLLEEEAFRLKQGELSGIVQVGDKFVIMFCEGLTKPETVALDEVRDLIVEDLREKKLDLAMVEEFDRLKKSAQVDNFLTSTSQTPEAVRVPARAELATRPGSKITR